MTECQSTSLNKSASNPDLIHKYLIRTRIPPAIMKPTPITTYNPLKAPQQQFCDMAYKHPQLLIDDKDNNAEKIIGSNEENDGDDDVETSTTKCELNKKQSNITHSKQNKYETMFKVNLFNANNFNVNHIAQKAINSSCKLIGNVKPNLVKTWEQLNGSISANTNQMQIIDYPVDYNLDSDDLKKENTDLSPQTTANKNESFIIQCSSTQSDHFYDSIDNESVVTQEDDDDQMISSLCYDMEHGGEAMAEYISLMEKKEKLCWSVDSCN